MLYLAIAALLLIAIGALVYAFFFNGSSEKQELSPVRTFRKRLDHASGLASGSVDNLVDRLEAVLNEDAILVEDMLGGLNRSNNDDYVEVLEEIRGRGLDVILPFATAWSRADVPLQRAAAADMLGGHREEQVPRGIRGQVTALLVALTADRDRRVVMCALQALRDRVGEPYPDRILADVRRNCAKHDDWLIRHAFLDELFPGAADSEQGNAVAIAMTRDPVARIRQQACFKLGSLSVIAGHDSPALRDALAACLDDPEPDVRSFAIEGLALRKDQRAIPALARDLAGAAEAIGLTDKGLDVEKLSEPEKQARIADFQRAMKVFEGLQQLTSAAAALPDRRLIPGLAALVERFPTQEYLDLLAACEALPASPQERAATAWKRKPAAEPPMAQDRSTSSAWGRQPDATAPATASGTLADPATLADHKALTKVLRKAPTSELVNALVHARAIGNEWAAQTIQQECNRRPCADIIAAARVAAADADPARRVAAALSLARELGEGGADRGSTDLLLTLAGDSEKSVAVAALNAIAMRLQRPFEPRTAARLAAFEKHPDEDVRLAYAQIFQSPYMHDELRDDSELDVWMRLLDDPSPRVRTLACAHLHHCACMPEASEMADRDDVRQALRRRLGDDDTDCRVRALMALALMEDRTVPAAIDRELARLAAVAGTMPLEPLLDIMNQVTESIGYHPLRRYTKALTQIAETVLARVDQAAVDGEEMGDPDTFAESLADLIQSCKAARGKMAG